MEIHPPRLKLADADPKDAQGQIRHSRIPTTMDIYMQFVSDSQELVLWDRCEKDGSHRNGGTVRLLTHVAPTPSFTDGSDSVRPV